MTQASTFFTNFFLWTSINLNSLGTNEKLTKSYIFFQGNLSFRTLCTRSVRKLSVRLASQMKNPQISFNNSAISNSSRVLLVDINSMLVASVLRQSSMILTPTSEISVLLSYPSSPFGQVGTNFIQKIALMPFDFILFSIYLNLPSRNLFHSIRVYFDRSFKVTPKLCSWLCWRKHSWQNLCKQVPSQQMMSSGS